jgi:hypothetical protein
MIIGMIKAHPTEHRMARQAVLGLTSLAHDGTCARATYWGGLGGYPGRHDHLIITLLVMATARPGRTHPRGLAATGLTS